MKFNIETAIEQSTEDGKLDAKKLMEFVDTNYVNPIVAKNKPDLDKITVEAKEKWIADLGFENVKDEAQLKAYVKGTSDEWKEKHSQLETNFNELKSKYDEKETAYNTVSSKMTSFERREQLLKDNFNGDAEYALFKINQNVSDDKDYETAYTEYKEAHTKDFAPNKVPNSTAKKVVTNEGSVKYGFEQILEEQGKL